MLSTRGTGTGEHERTLAGLNMTLVDFISVSLICDITLVLIFVIATASNSLVLLVFYRKPGLRTISNRFVINMLATNLVSCWLLLPLLLADSLLLLPSSDGSHSLSLCALSQGASTGVSAASVLSILLIGVDQYYAVIDPLHYHSHIDNTKSALMITLSWCFSLFCAVVGGLFYHAPHSIWNSCGRQSATFLPFVPDLYISIFSIVYSILTFFLPFSAICWMYLSIYFAAHKNIQRTRRNGSHSGFYLTNAVNNPPIDYATVPASTRSCPSSRPPSASDSPELSVKSVDVADPSVFVKPTITRSPTRTSLRSTSSFIMNTLRCRISNASMFKYREETRAARISALVIVMGLVCWCPYSLVVMLSSPVIGLQIPHEVAKPSITLLVVTTVVSPLLFAHRNRRIQRDLRKLFGLARRPETCQKPRDRGQSQHQSQPQPQGQGARAARVLPPNYSHTALELLASLAEGGDEHVHDKDLPEENSGSFLSRVWWKEGVQLVTKIDKLSGKSLICAPEVALDVDNSRSSFSSGGSGSTRRSTSATSISSFIGDEC